MICVSSVPSSWIDRMHFFFTMVDRILASHLLFNAVYNDNERLSVDDEFYQKHQASFLSKITLSNDSIHCF